MVDMNPVTPIPNAWTMGRMIGQSQVRVMHVVPKNFRSRWKAAGLEFFVSFNESGIKSCRCPTLGVNR